jgi:peptidoglycan/LPS O-acetylase OafA/YrhL
MAELKIELSGPVSGHLPVLDELKGLAIGLIVLYHAGGVLVWNNYHLQGRWFHTAQPGAPALIAGMVVAVAVTLLASVELRRLLQKLPFPAKA